MSDFNQLHFYNTTTKSVFDLKLAVQMNPQSSKTQWNSTATNPTKAPVLNLSFFDMLIDKVSELPKNKDLVKAIKNAKNLVNAKANNVSGMGWCHEHYPPPSRIYNPSAPPTPPLTTKDWEQALHKIEKEFFLTEPLSRGKMEFPQNYDQIIVPNNLQYGYASYNFVPKAVVLKVEKTWPKEEKCPLYSKSHIEKTLSFLNKIEKLIKNMDAALAETDKFYATYQTKEVSVDYLKYNTISVYDIKRKYLPLINPEGEDQQPRLIFKTTYGHILGDFKKCLELLKKDFTPLYEKYIKEKLNTDEITYKEYKGSFERQEDFDDQSKYVYLVENRKGQVGFIGIKFVSKATASYTRTAVDLVKDVSRALIFDTPNPAECGIGQVKEGYEYVSIKPLSLELAFKPVEYSFTNPKMQDVANIVLKKNLEKDLNTFLGTAPSKEAEPSEKIAAPKKHKI